MASKGRKSGVPNYKKDVLLNIVASLLPVSTLDWENVVTRYRETTGEIFTREAGEVKRTFLQNNKMCNRGVKPTGNSGANSSVLRAQKIYAKILAKQESINLNANSEDDEEEEEHLD